MLGIESFQPHRLLRNGHLQTVVGLYLPVRLPSFPSRQHPVRLPDEDVLIVHDICPADWRSGDRVMIAAHGLGGSAQSGYMKRLAVRAAEIGIRSIRIDLRGFGESQLTTRHVGHIGRSDDLEAVLEFVIQLCPGSPISLIGFSYGANITLKLLGECSDRIPEPVDSAIVVSPPIDPLCCCLNLQRGVNRIYDYYFTSTLKRVVARRRRMIKGLVDIPQIKLPNRLYDFDDVYTSRLAGFRNAEEYYSMCGAAPLLDQVAVRTLMIVAKDDPLIPFSMFERCPLSPAIELQVIERGGHLGFLSQRPPLSARDSRWLDWTILDWIDKVEHQHEQVSDNAST